MAAKANKPTVVLPSMGTSQNTYRMLCNVVSRMGVIERRPRIVATETGYSVSTIGSDNLAFGPQWRVHSKTDADIVVLDPPGGLTASASYITTDYELQEAGTTNTPKDISAVSFSSGMATVDTTGSHALTVGDKVYVYQADTGAAGPGVGEHVHSRSFAGAQRCLEGIDCEIVNGKIVAIYLGKESLATTALGFYHSYHSPGDPRLGFTELITAAGSTKSDSPAQWYSQASYWTKRITPIFTDYMITGYNVGPAVVGGSTVAEINEHDSVSLFSGLPLKMFGDKSVQSTIARVDPYSSFYNLYSPKNAFAHTDRHSGQTIWYGFLDGDPYDLTGELPAELALLMAYNADISPSRQTVFVRPSHIWYSEPASPLSLSVTGWYPMVVGSRNMEIVGMADFKNGTAIFSHDTIHFMRGIGADVGSNAAARVTLHSGIGSDSRWSIKSIGDGVAFANKNGLWYLGDDNKVREVTAFKELFSESGVDCARGPYHEYFGTIGNTPSENADDASGSYQVADNAYSTFDSHPWRTFKIDKARLDRAVAGVWDDLYLLFVSLDSDDYGEDNRLCLCWNWKETAGASLRSAWTAGPTSVWLMPKNMGVRGWAYDGSLSTPFVMTRYGLAKFEKSLDMDVVWVNAGPTETNGTARVPEHHPAHDINATDGIGHLTTVYSADNPPMPIVMGQSHWLPESGDSLVTTNVIVQHETIHDALGSAEAWTDFLGVSRTYNGASPTAGCGGGDLDGKMRIRIWAMQGEIMQSSGNFSSFPFGKMRFTKADIGPLENLVARSGFKLWRGRHVRRHAVTWGPLDTEGTVRLPGGIRRASSARGGFSSSRCAFQFSTSNPDKILSVQVIMDPVAPRGEGA